MLASFARVTLVCSISIVFICSAGCGGAGGTTPVLVPSAVSLMPGDKQSFTAQGLGTPVTWSVNGVPGGNTAVGTIDSEGSYSTPQASPLPDSLTITATDSKSN